MKKLLVFLIFLTLTLFVSGCANEDEEVDIYTTIYPVEFIVKEIVKDRFKVGSIYPRGKDVHDYELSPKDIIKMSKSQIIFYIGLGLESFVERSKDTSFKDVPTVTISKGLEVVLLNDEDYEKHIYDGGNVEFYDPHIWLDPNKMIQMAVNVLDGLIEHLDVNEEDIAFFNENFNELKSELQKLDAEIRVAVSAVNIKNRTIMVDHDAYVYWTLAYGIERIKMRNHNDSSDIDPQVMQQKITLAKSLDIKHVITTKNEIESSIISQYLNELGLSNNAKEALHHLGTITSAEDKAGENYFSIMRTNLEVLKKVFPKV